MMRFLNFDLDDILAYSTPKVVVIKDRWLGFLRLSLLATTFVYFVIGQLWTNQQYLALKPVTAAIQVKLKEPMNKSSVPNDLPYCSQFSKVLPNQLLCRAQPYEYMIHGSEANQLFVTTSIYWKQWTCLDKGRSAGELEACEIESPPEYVPDVEEYLLVLRHSTQSLNSLSMKGYVLHDDGSRQPVVRRKYKGSDAGLYDVLVVKDLLELLGIASLDDTYDGNHVLRRTGLTLTLNIHYEHDWLGRTYSYTYSARRQETKLARKVTVVGARRGNATLPGVVKRNGLQINLRYTGEEGRVGFAPFLLAVVSSLALIAISNNVVDILSTRVMPNRNLYKLAKFEATVDFSDYKNSECHAVSGVNYMLDHHGRLCGKTHEIEVSRVGSLGHISRVRSSDRLPDHIETSSERLANQPGAPGAPTGEALQQVVQEVKDVSYALYKDSDARTVVGKKSTGEPLGTSSSSSASASKDRLPPLRSETASFSPVSKDELSVLRSEILLLASKMREVQCELTQCRADVAQLQRQESAAPIDSRVAETEPYWCAEIEEHLARLRAEMRREREEWLMSASPGRPMLDAQQRLSKVSSETESNEYARLEERLIALESHRQRLEEDLLASNASSETKEAEERLLALGETIKAVRVALKYTPRSDGTEGKDLQSPGLRGEAPLGLPGRSRWGANFNTGRPASTARVVAFSERLEAHL